MVGFRLISVLVGILVGFSSGANASLCKKPGDGAELLSVQDLVSLPEFERFSQIRDESQELVLQASQLYGRLIRRSSFQSAPTPHDWQNLKARFLAWKAGLVTYLGQRPNVLLAEDLSASIQNSFVVAAHLLVGESLRLGHSISSLVKLASDSDVIMPGSVFVELFPDKSTLANEILVTPESNGNIRLRFTRSATFKIALDSIGRFSQWRDVGDLYLAVVKCQLAALSMNKFVQLESLLYENKQVFGRLEGLCLSIPSEELYSMSKELVVSDLLERKSKASLFEVQEHNPFLNMDRKYGPWLTEKKVRYSTSEASFVDRALDLFVKPEAFYEAGAQVLNSGSGYLTRAEFNEWRRHTVQLVLSGRKNELSLSGFFGLSQTDSFKKLVADSINSCNDSSSIELAPQSVTDVFWNDLAKFEEMDFYARLLNVPDLPYHQFSESELINVLNGIIKKAKVDSLAAAISSTLSHHNVMDPLVDPGEFSYSLRPQIAEYFDRVIENSKVKEAVQSFVKAWVERFFARWNGAFPFVSAREIYLDNLLESARRGKFYLDKSTPIKDLPYRPTVIQTVLSEEIKALSPTALQWLTVVGSQPDFVTRKASASQVLEILHQEALKHSESYSKPLSRLGVPANLQADYEGLKRVFGKLGFTREQEPQTLQDIWFELTAGLKPSHQSQISKMYRELLREEELAQFRILESTAFDFAKLRSKRTDDDLSSYLAQPAIAEASKATSPGQVAAGKAVSSALRKAKDNLQNEMQKIAQAEVAYDPLGRQKDLRFFINHSRVINYLLGDSSLTQALLLNDLNSESALFSHNVTSRFPVLAKYHESLEKRIELDRLTRDGVVKDVSGQVMFGVLPILGFWVVKRFVDPSLLRGLLAPALLRVTERTRPLIRGYWSALGVFFAAEAGYIAFKKRPEINSIMIDLQRASISEANQIWGPTLLDAELYRSQTTYYQQEYSSWTNQMWFDVAFFAMPLMVQPLTPIFQKTSQTILGRRERIMEEALTTSGRFTGKPIPADIFLKRHLYRIEKKIKHLERSLSWYFRDLEIVKPTWLERDWRAALDRIEASRDVKKLAKAREAYEILVVKVTRELQPILTTPRQLEAYAEIMYPGVDAEGALKELFQAANQLISKRKSI